MGTPQETEENRISAVGEPGRVEETTRNFK